MSQLEESISSHCGGGVLGLHCVGDHGFDCVVDRVKVCFRVGLDVNVQISEDGNCVGQFIQ